MLVARKIPANIIISWTNEESDKLLAVMNSSTNQITIDFHANGFDKDTDGETGWKSVTSRNKTIFIKGSLTPEIISKIVT